MILLTDEEINDVLNAEILIPFGEKYSRVAKAQIKKTLISVGRESKRMDGTIYLVPDYVEYRKALKGVGLE